MAYVPCTMLGLLYSDSHADIEDGEVDPELVVPHLPHVDQVLLAAAVRSGAHISHLMISWCYMLHSFFTPSISVVQLAFWESKKYF